MAPLTYARLLELARLAEGQTLHTVTGRAFTAGISRTSELFFTPGRKAHERFVARFNEIGSMRDLRVVDRPRNASYLLGLRNWAEAREEQFLQR